MTYSVTPLFAFTAQDASLTAATSVMIMSLLISTGSTYLVQYCCKPYVVSITKTSPEPISSNREEAKETLEFETTNFFGFPKRTIVKGNELEKSSSRVFSTWKTASSYFYVHPELAEGFTPEMEKLKERIEGDASGSRPAGAANNQKAGSGKEDFDRLVNQFRHQDQGRQSQPIEGRKE
ncbi:hypothetical protein HDU97_002271 [Phlyctochytrium planicorne]|nr:hypothetical protein HDU97_002271 [Phlyctochytrium planicorne]